MAMQWSRCGSVSVSKDFEDLFACLNARRVKALVVGAHAVAFHAWRGRVADRYGAAEVCYLGKEELIRNKSASGRPQDRLDLAMLEEPS
jgi:hypothetical protein